MTAPTEEHEQPAPLGRRVSRYRWAVVAAWIALLVGLRWVAPAWDSVTYDGDFAYLPDSMPSIVGDRWMSAAFPHQRAKSQFVVAIVRHWQPMTKDDLDLAYDVARRMKNLFGASQLAAARRWAGELQRARREQPRQVELLTSRLERSLERAARALDDAVELDQRLADYWDSHVQDDPESVKWRPRRLAAAFHNQALLAELQGDATRSSERREVAAKLDPDLAGRTTVAPAAAADLPLVDVWTWHDEYFGGNLISRDRSVRLIVMQLSNEFMAVDNIHVAERIEAELQPVRSSLAARASPGLSIIQSGSAAVGADMLRSAAAAIHHTEVFSVALVMLILTLVYRAPLLLAIPLVTIGIALSVSTSLVALLASVSQSMQLGAWSIKVFSTTRIFIVVILFGAGTDFCLFLIARYKEELQRGRDHRPAVAHALRGVSRALLGSALTTIVGLSMMVFADFGKFRYSGPVIGLCLAITLLTSLTLTPALLAICGRWLFWPRGIRRRTGSKQHGTEQRGTEQQGTGSRPRDVRNPGDRPAAGPAPTQGRFSLAVTRFWTLVARTILARPGTILMVAVASMIPAAFYGWTHADDVTYDFLSSLPRQTPSRLGTAVLRRHFPVGESGPVTVLVKRPGARFLSADGREQIAELSDRLHLPGVATVRSSEDPLGQYGPGEKPGIISERARQLRLLRVHPRTQAIFISPVKELQGDVARLELILDHDPFSVAALEVVDRVDQRLRALAARPDSFWRDADFALTGISAAIRDLRTATRRDHRRIELLVVLAVWTVLVVLLRRPVVSLFMMASVLLSYYVTLGCAALFFEQVYGSSFQGLDWKVPLFLFVILVAIGQDYNVYLVTRVFEEQRRWGRVAGLRRAIVHTGGIITSCGLIMAGTFASMTSAAWSHLLPPIGRLAAAAPVQGALAHGSPAQGALRSVVELGCALALGVLLDTLIVRPVLMPSFLALTRIYARPRGYLAKRSADSASAAAS